MTRWYDFHRRLCVSVEDGCRSDASLAMEWAPFASAPLDRIDLGIDGGAIASFAGDEAAFGDTVCTYDHARVLVHRLGLCVERVADGGLRAHARQDVYPFVEPLMGYPLLEHGTVALHGAAVRLGDEGVFIPAWGGTGKTSLVVRLVREQRAGFLADDNVFLTAEGTLLGYPRPLTIYPYHRPLFPHLFGGLHKPLVPARLSRPVEALREAVRPTFSRIPAVERWGRRLTPEYRKVAPEEALPGVEIVAEAPLRRVIALERYSGDRLSVEARDGAWLIPRLIGNFDLELGARGTFLASVLGAAGWFPVEQWYERRRALLEEAIGDVPIHLVRIPHTLGANEASAVIADAMMRLTADQRGAS